MDSVPINDLRKLQNFPSLCTSCYLLILFCIQSFAFSCNRKLDSNEIASGKGIGEIRLGMKYEDFLHIMGPPKNIMSPDELRNDYAMMEINPDQEILFYLGFDKQLSYQSEINKTSYPIFEASFKEEKLMYISLSSFIYSNKDLSLLKVDKQISFGDDKAKLESTFGKSYISYKPSHALPLEEYIFVDKGISFSLEQNKITVIDIYTPFTSENQKDFELLLKE